MPLHLTGPCALPTPWGSFSLFGVRDGKGTEFSFLQCGDPAAERAPLVRLHSACLTGESFLSLRCDCREQLSLALEAIAREGAGLVIHLAQEGRGIGLANKIAAYALQDAGCDTIEANLALGLQIDDRSYSAAAELLLLRGVKTLRLLSHNPVKRSALEARGIAVLEMVGQKVSRNAHNRRYIETKISRMGHSYG